MEDCSDFDTYEARWRLSEFAARLHELCQGEPVTFFAGLPGKGIRINAVELAEGGLNLILEEKGLFFFAMEDIGKNTFHRKHADSMWIVPSWL